MTHWLAKLIKEPQVPESDIVSKYKVATPEATTPKVERPTYYMYTHPTQEHMQPYINTYKRAKQLLEYISKSPIVRNPISPKDLPSVLKSTDDSLPW